jgi:type VI secretion system protein ImpC
MAKTHTPAAQGTSASATTTSALLEAIVEETHVHPADEGYSQAKRGVEALVGHIVSRGLPAEQVDRRLVDAMIAEIDERVSRQVDEILHHEKFQKIESAWRSLKFLTDRTDFRENIRIHFLQATKQELLYDFEDATETVTSGLYRHVYTAEYGQFGGRPIGAMIANYEFGIGNEDLSLLRYCASVAAMAHCPFITGTAPSIFVPEAQDFRELPYLKDLDALFESPRYIKWRSFRESEDSRYVGLAMPRFLLRTPYGGEELGCRTFNYKEEIRQSHRNYLWGNAAFAMATRLTDSFAKYRLCANIIGPQAGGAVEDLPIHLYQAMGDIQVKIPTEVLVSERREFELSEQGFIALTMRKDSDNAAFFSANSAQKPKYFGKSEEGRAAEVNSRLGGQLPYLFIVCRLAHYIKVMQRENIGKWMSKQDLNNQLNSWIQDYIVANETAPGWLKAERPLKYAMITVEDVEGNPGWYKVDIKVVPHYKYMGAFFTLSLVGKLDKQTAKK